jgi:ribose 5-phosphate isomerase B
MIYLGADHGGFELKEKIKGWLSADGIKSEDLGAYSKDLEDDYPDFIIPVAQKVASESGSLGIILGRSGNGEAIAANKVKGVRAAVCLNEQMAKKSKDDNNANVLSLPADYIDEETAKKIIKAFLNTPFSNAERHIRRLKKIEEIENQ